MDFVPIIIFWLLALWSITGKETRILYLLFGSMPFGSFAVISPAITGGLTFTGAPIAALLLCARVFADRKTNAHIAAAALDFGRLGFLSVFWLIALVVTLFGPKLFANQIDVINVRGLVARASPLVPTTQNLSQFLYLTISVLTVYAFTPILRSREGIIESIKALHLGGWIVILTGFLDILNQKVNIGWLLEPFRTATYSMMLDGEILGAKRIIGLTPEASAFGGLCLTFAPAIYFLSRALPPGKLKRLSAPICTLILTGLAALSTSSAAYVGLITFALVFLGDWTLRSAVPALNFGQRSHPTRDMAAFVIAVTVAAAVLFCQPDLLDPAVQMFDRMVLQKSASQSFVERSMWTRVSWEALWSSHGFGVGVGSTRASNRMAVVAASTGILGAITFVLFHCVCYFRKLPRTPLYGSVAFNARLTYAPGFIIALLVGTVVDFGVFNGFLFALMALASAGPSTSASPKREPGRTRLPASRHVHSKV